MNSRCTGLIRVRAGVKIAVIGESSCAEQQQAPGFQIELKWLGSVGGQNYPLILIYLTEL